MAIDSENKRRSVDDMTVVNLIGPVPDDDIDSVSDRRHMCGLYRFEEPLGTFGGLKYDHRKLEE